MEGCDHIKQEASIGPFFAPGEHDVYVKAIKNQHCRKVYDIKHKCIIIIESEITYKILIKKLEFFENLSFLVEI